MQQQQPKMQFCSIQAGAGAVRNPLFLLLLLLLQVSYAECGNVPGRAPIVTIATLHQVHYLLFFLAITHIVTGVVTLLISSAKLK
jgi:hypothetical protein